MLKNLALAVSVAGVVLALAAAAASASTYTYCGGCVINSGAHKTSSTFYGYRSYGHRTGGPGSGVQMRVTATGVGVCDTGWYYTDEMWCDIPSRANIVGRTYNGGAGNYTFNAHLTN
jgi:hypothetical protein